MRFVAVIAAVAVLAAAVAGCSSESYYGPAYYRTAPYGYSYPQYSPRRAYDGYWDYRRNYRGIGASPEFSSM